MSLPSTVLTTIDFAAMSTLVIVASVALPWASPTAAQKANTTLRITAFFITPTSMNECGAP